MQRVQEALAQTGVPAWPQRWRATAAQPEAPDAYIVYTTMISEGWHDDDVCSYYATYVYMNLYSKGDPSQARRAIRDAMRGAGFAMIEESDRTDNTSKSEYDPALERYITAWTWVIRTAEAE